MSVIERQPRRPSWWPPEYDSWNSEQRGMFNADVYARTAKPRLRYCPYVPTAKQIAFLLRTDLEAFYGGAAGPGKSTALLMAALQFVDVPGYAALLLRQTYQELSLPGALIPMASEWLSGTGATWNGTNHTWTFPGTGSTLTFGYLQHAHDKYRYKCFSDDTELLTDSGWQSVSDIHVGDRCATLDPETRELHFRPASATWSYDYDGQMVEVDQRQGVSFCVTPNHEIPHTTYRRRGKALRFCEADALPATACIPQWQRIPEPHGAAPTILLEPSTSGTRSRSYEPQIDDWAELVGWYIAEGGTDQGGNRYGIKISQRPGWASDRIRDLVARCGHRAWQSGTGVAFAGRAPYEWFQQCGTGSRNKRIPRMAFSWPVFALRRLLWALVEGDGTWRREGRSGHFVTTSRQLADDVMELAVRTGWRPTLNDATEYAPHGVTSYHVSLLMGSRDTMIGPTRRVRYTGMVHCVTVPPFHTVLIRRNGRVSWSGQSSQFAYIGFDELTEFDEEDYEYLFSRLRKPHMSIPSASDPVTLDDVPLRMRGASNPGGPGHEWVNERFVDDQTREQGRVYIPALLTENPHIDREAYERNLMMIRGADRDRLLKGDWGVIDIGDVFDIDRIILVEDWAPAVGVIRYWDLAATEPHEGNRDPDYTTGTRLELGEDGYITITSILHTRLGPGAVERFVQDAAIRDGYHVRVYIEQDPGQAGKAQVHNYARLMPGVQVHPGLTKNVDKRTRSTGAAAAFENGVLRINKHLPNLRTVLLELNRFPKPGSHDDIVDTITGGYTHLTQGGVQSVTSVSSVATQGHAQGSGARTPADLPRSPVSVAEMMRNRQ